MTWAAYCYFVAGSICLGIAAADRWQHRRWWKRMKKVDDDLVAAHNKIMANSLGLSDIVDWHRNHGNFLRCTECYVELDGPGCEQTFILARLASKRVDAYCSTHAPPPPDGTTIYDYTE